jgi:hypothetical protein
MFSKKKEIKILKIKRLFSFIIACYFKSLNTIQIFREIKKTKSINIKKLSSYFSKRYRCR